MSFEDHIFEDYCESRERSYEDGNYYKSRSYYEPEYTGKKQWIKENLKKVKRICTKCGYEFKSRTAKACKECGGWTELKDKS